MSRLPQIDVSELSVPVGVRGRLLDALCLASGVVLMSVAVIQGGRSMILLLPGLGFLGVGVFLLSRRRRLAEPATMVRWFQQSLDERYGTGARSPEERAERAVVFMQVAAKLAELGAGEPSWAVIGGAGGFAGRVMFVEVVSQPAGRRVCLLVPEPPGAPAFFVEAVANDERQGVEGVFEHSEQQTPNVWRVDCRDHNAAAAAIERAFVQVLGCSVDHEAHYRLCSAQPAWALGGSSSG